MAELFRIETDRVTLILSGPLPEHAKGPTGALRIWPQRRDLTLRPGTARAGVSDAVARDPAETAGPPLHEETAYDLWLSSYHGERVELSHRDPALLTHLHAAPGRAQAYGHINFGGQVGLSRFSVRVDGEPELDLEVEVFPTKMAYRADYVAMREEVHAFAAGLALEYLRATHYGSATARHRPSGRLEWLALLRHLVGQLEQALHHVAQHPVRSLQRRDRPVRAEAVRRPDNRVRRALRTGRGQGGWAGQVQGGLPARQRVPEQRPVPSLDTPEHRWLAQQLRRIRQQLAQIVEDERHRQRQGHHAGSGGAQRDCQALAELAALERRIATLERLEPLAEAGGPPPPGFASLRLQGSPGYKEAYQVLLTLRQGISIRGGPMELSVKDIHQLYEYWCFLALLRTVAEVLEQPIPPERLLTVQADGLRVRLARGRKHTVPFDLPGERRLEVVYNPSFRDGGTFLPQQPDFALTLRDPAWPTVRLVLDAKYRVEDDAATRERLGAASPPADAVNVLHRYRDAILEQEGSGAGHPLGAERSGIGGSADQGRPTAQRTVIEGAALYPLDADGAADFGQTRLWQGLERLGVGALPFLPGSTHWVRQWLHHVLQRSGWRTAEAVVPHSAERQRHAWHRLAAEVVLVAVLRPQEERAHLDWIARAQRYYTPWTPSQARQHQAGIVAFYTPASVRPGDEPGAVIHWAEVTGIEVLPREQIATPWPTRRGADKLQVLYHLGPLQALEAPIINRDGGRGQRFSTNRWSSRLAFQRARNITELLLESAPEWALYEALRARGADLELRALPPRDPAAAGRRARVAFHVAGRRAHYLDGERFEVVGSNGSRRELPREAAAEALIGAREDGPL
ncbi:DUF2357 domain-containing protein [Halorhodospira halophila]|uniref:DUF2357 domain-containing protein n=1 Tax=Halorhodospira TaxID=85108 RepID=UPI001EE7E0BD|nr:restriction endonuclease-like protein [Halorhodospira halophila]MCG5544047.1 restriction endonuclease-like protein [Halorhodospira sp. 9628]